MRVAKQSNHNIQKNNEQYAKTVDSDLKNLFICLQGRLRFGDANDDETGENISGVFKTFTTNASANTEFTVDHNLGISPVGYLVMGQDKAGSLYQLSDTGTSWTATSAYLKCDASSVTFKVFFLK